MKRNSRSCGVLVFMFNGEIELLREKAATENITWEHSSPSFHIPSSSFLSLVSPLLLVPSVSLSLMRLVYASRPSVSFSSIVPAAITFLPL